MAISITKSSMSLGNMISVFVCFISVDWNFILIYKDDRYDDS